jgi:AcrR family transcriptional regulator
MSTVPEPAETRRLHRHNAARQTILDAAQELLLAEGIHGFTMRRLAKRCGYTAPTIYHYFGDKHGLLDTLLEQVFHGLVTELEKVPQESDPLEALRGDFRAIVDFGVSNPRHYQLLLAARPEGAEPLPSDEAARQRLEAPLTRLFEAGCLRADEFEQARQALWALLHGLISLQTHRPDVDWAPELAERSLEWMLRGLVRADSPALGRRGR